jgi:putative transposase
MDTTPESERDIADPKPGFRFELYGAHFEVTIVHAGMVRYAATAGGRQHRIQLVEFRKLRRAGLLLPSNDSPPSVEQEAAPVPLSTMSAVESRGTIRTRRYVSAAITELSSPRSLTALVSVIASTSALIEDGKPPSPRTVARWVKKHLENRPLVATGRRSSGNRTLRFTPDVELKFLEALPVYLTPEHRECKDVRDTLIGLLAEGNLLSSDGKPVKVMSLRTVQRRIRKLDPFEVVRARKGPQAALRFARASGTKIISPRPLLFVMIDTHCVDVLVIDPDTGEIIGRPYLVCILDVRTRAIVGFHVSMRAPSAITTLAAMKSMLRRGNHGLPGGVPISVTPDNGVEFANTPVQRLWGHLNCIVEPAQKADPNGKANLESFFRTYERALVHKLTGTTFSNPTERGNYPSADRARFTLTQIRDFTAEWIDSVYHCTVHTQTGRAPAIMFEQEMKGIPTVSLSDEDIDAIVRRPVQCTINDGQVRIDYIDYYSHALRTLEMQGERKVVASIDDDDLNSVLVEHPTERGVLILAESTNPAYTCGLSFDEHRAARKIREGFSQGDLQALGPYAAELSRWHLMKRIHSESVQAAREIQRLRQAARDRASSAKGKAGSVDPSPAVDGSAATALPSPAKLSVPQNILDALTAAPGDTAAIPAPGPDDANQPRPQSIEIDFRRRYR